MRRIKLGRVLQKISDALPRRYPVISKVGLKVNPFFVFGSGRNGSTLLNRMLNQHSELFLPSEQYFLGNSIIKYKLYNFLLWRDLMKIIGGELVPQTKSHSWDMDAGAVLPALFEIQDKSLQAVIDSIYRIYGSVISEGYTIWGDTTPLNTYYLPEIYSLFPDAKYIFLIRDGRDVVASYKKGGEAHMGNLANPVASMHYWQDSINQYDWLKKRTKVVTVKYEMLVQNPEEELARVCDHLGINFEAGMLQFFAQDQLPGFYDEPHHANLRRAVFTGSVGNWKTALTEPERLQMSVLDEHLKRFGYH